MRDTSLAGKLAEHIEHRWLGLGDTSLIEVANPLLYKSRADAEEPVLHLVRLMRDPANLWFTARTLFDIDLAPFQMAILHELWNRPYPMLIGSRGCGKSSLLAIYILLRLLLNPGIKIVVVGAAFRQAKMVFEYCETVWKNSPILQDVCGASKDNRPSRAVDRCVFQVGTSVANFIPTGDGSRIRGFRANIIIADEFSAQSEEVFENVISGFASVSMNPIEKMKSEGRAEALREMGLEAPEEESIPGLTVNQTVLAGTAYYSFNHFYRYWKRWKSIVESRGDRRTLEEAIGGPVPEKFSWKDYSVIRLPANMLPNGFMEAKHLAKQRATIHLTQYLLEYGAVFATDSNGFFKRSLIESCTAGRPGAPIVHPSGLVSFTAMLRGDPSKRYVLGVDPAAESDNFSIIVMELWPEHRRIVHCWTTTRKRHKAKLGKGLAKEQDFYHYVARKIRELMVLFPAERIALDKQGGGVSVLEALADTSRLQEGEEAILPLIIDDEPQETDDLPGLHIVDVVQFARSEWVGEANHGLRKDMESKAIVFPEFDAAALGLAIEEDKATGRVSDDPDMEKLHDTLEDCMMEIMELKDELACIVQSQTAQGNRDRWDTPEVKLPGSRKGRMRKDRYSALLMANMAGRAVGRIQPVEAYPWLGGFAHVLAGKKPGKDRKHRNPSWYEQGTAGAYGMAVRRGQD